MKQNATGDTVCGVAREVVRSTHTQKFLSCFVPQVLTGELRDLEQSQQELIV